MIWAGIVFLMNKTGQSEEDIKRFPYPKFKAMIEYYGDPEKFIKQGVSETDYKTTIASMQKHNMAMAKAASEKQKKKEKD